MIKSITTGDLIISRIARFSRLTTKVVEEGLKPLGLSLQEMRIAGLILGEDNLTQKALAEKLSVKPATLSVAISKLESQGIVKRIVDSKDKRVNFLRLLKSKKYARVDDILIGLENRICQGISEKDLEVTQKVINQLINNAEELYRSS